MMKKLFASLRSQPQLTRIFTLAALALSLTALMFFAFGLLLPSAQHAQTSTHASVNKHLSAQTPASPPTHTAKQSSNNKPAATPGSSDKQAVTHKPTAVATSLATPSATPTLIPSTPQSTQLGVFPLSSGGPLPVPEAVLQPTNIARVKMGTTLISIYAGSMTHNPQIGTL